MSVRNPLLPLSLGAAAMLVVIAACSEPSSAPVATMEAIGPTITSLALCADDGLPPPPPSDTSSSFDYNSTAMLDAPSVLLPAANMGATAGAGYLEETNRVTVQSTYLLNDANGNGFISFDKVPGVISANARITIRNCEITGGQGTISLPTLSGRLVFDLKAAGAVTGSAALCSPSSPAQGRLGCFTLALTGGRLLDASGTPIGTGGTASFTLGVRCTYAMQEAGICTVPIVKEDVIG